MVFASFPLVVIAGFPALSLYFSSTSSYVHRQCVLFLAFAVSSMFPRGFSHDFLWSLSCFPAVSTFPRGFSMYLFIFNVVFQEFYPSPSFSDGFCNISSGCYHIFLHFHCIFAAFWLHRHGLFLAFAPVSSIFQSILHGLFLAFRSGFLHFPMGFCTISPDRYHVFLQFHFIFQYILMVSPANKKADLGGIDSPPSANYLVVHNPAKCSVFWR